MIDIDDIKRRVDEIFEETVEIRRHLHMYPELSGHERETSLLIQKKLDELDIDYKKDVAGYGIAGTIYGNNPLHGVGIRADMDALPLTEDTNLSFKSKNKGVMHACGHDIHTAILLGTAKILNEIREEMPGCIRLLFQPSEETVGGAMQMIEAGCLKSPEINSIIGLHVKPSVPAGYVELIPDVMNAASCEFHVTVHGKTCHGAYPSQGIDSLLPACAMVSGLQSVITRRIPPTEAALISIGKFSSGIKNNIISGKTNFSGIIRTLNMEMRSFIKEQMKEMCISTAAAYGATCEINFQDSYPALINDGELMGWISESFREAIGREKVLMNSSPSLGADDFAYFCHGTRGFYYNIGTKNSDEESDYPIHSEKFNPDEKCIKTGILSEVVAALKIMEEERKTWAEL